MTTLPVGAQCLDSGVSYRVWAPDILQIHVDVQSDDSGKSRLVALAANCNGYHEGVDPQGRAGDAYYYVFNGGEKLPDPASRGQQTDVHGRSLVVDPRFSWTDKNWKRPAFRDLVIYELHVGTFTEEGTFLKAMDRLESLRDLGITAIELMPLADFPGERGWGYDGVLIFAPARTYGTPEDLRSLVDHAHSLGIAVILDVVYNHFGPAGNYIGRFCKSYFTERHHTPWGSAFNFDSDRCEPVREFFLSNPIFWMEEFHMDGFRMDATHEIQDDSATHILAAISEAVHRRGGYVMAEDDRNSDVLITPLNEGGMGFDGVWADDFHHSVRVSQTGEDFSYFADYRGSMDEVVSTLDNGWLYRGQVSPRSGRPRGTPCRHLPPERFVHCISNHDQTGNRAMGERISALTSPAAYRTASALLCLAPYTPLLFMGQEWAASTPFFYFTDHEPDLGAKITDGRRREFAGFPEFVDAVARERIPDPQDRKTFLQSKLRWAELQEPAHAAIRALYAECLHLRKELSALRPVEHSVWSAKELSWGAGVVRYEEAGSEILIVFDLKGQHGGEIGIDAHWRERLSTGNPRFGGGGEVVVDLASRRVEFHAPGLIVFTR